MRLNLVNFVKSGSQHQTMAKKYLSVIFVLVCGSLLDAAKLEDKSHSRQKRTVISTLSNWWYGEPTTPVPVEELSFRDDLNYVNYPYYHPTGVGAYPIQYIPQPPPPQSDDDLGRLARELGIRHIRNLPKIEEVMGLLGTNTKDETIQAIREFAATPGGVDMIESFLAPESEEVKEEYRPINNVKQEVVQDSRAPVPVQNIIPTETVQKLPEQLRTGTHQPKALSLQPQTDEQRFDQTRERFSTDMELFQQVPHETPGFFSRLGYYANFLNPFSLTQSAEVPLPTEKATVVTGRPVVYRYPEGYDPHTKSFTNTKERVELLEAEHQKLTGEHKAQQTSQHNSGPFVRFPQEIQPLIRTPHNPHNAVLNAPIPAYIYQSGPGNPYFVDQHRLAANGAFYPSPQQPQSVPPPQSVPVTIDLTNDEYSPSQVEALRQQENIKGPFVTVPLPPVVNSAVTNYNGDEGSYNIDVRFGHPINIVDHVASGSEVHETVVEKEEENKETSSTTEQTTNNKDVETLKLIPVHTTESTSPTTTTEKPVKKDETTAEESKINIVTVLPDNDFTYEAFDAPKEIGQKVIESVSNLTVESLSEQETKKQAESEQ